MAILTITNTSGEALPLGDLGSKFLAVGEAVTIERPASALPAMRSLIAALAADKITVTVTPSAAEVASGFLAPPKAVQGVDVAPVNAGAAPGGPVVPMRFPAFAAGDGGSADDVELIAVNSLPFKFRVLMAFLVVTTAVSAAHVDLYTRPSAGGTRLSVNAAGSVGTSLSTQNTAVATPGSLNGLFARRSDSGVAGELILLVQIEN